MSQIPFVNQLGDAIETAIERDAARSAAVGTPGAEPERQQRLTRAAVGGKWRRASLVLAVLAVAGATAAIAQTLQHSTRLVAGGIACYAGAGTDAPPYYNVEAKGRTPEAACKQVFRTDGPAALGQPGVKLVACADPHGYVAVFKATGASAQCGSAGMSPLQAKPYAAAQSRVDRLVAALAAIGANHRCVAPSTLVGDSQRELDRLGWRGWHAQLHAQPVGQRGCGLFEGTGSSFSDPTASLDAVHHTVWIVSGPIPALIQLTASQDMKLRQASGEHCYTPAGARALVRDALASAGVQIQFALTREPRGEQVAYAQHAYDRGCTIVGTIMAAPRGRIVRAWLNAKSAPAAPSSGPWPGLLQAPQPR
jgi:hypothetical protein